MKKVAKIGQYTLLKNNKGYDVDSFVGLAFGRPVSLVTALRRIDKWIKEDNQKAIDTLDKHINKAVGMAKFDMERYLS